MYIKVHVFPESKKEMIEIKSSDRLDVFVKEKRQGGAVNKRLIELIKEFYKKDTNPEVRIISGHLSTSKILSINYHND